MQYDAIVIGSGPNGLAAAITLAQAGWSVAVYEARDTVGGGMRSAELTLPGFVHDICSAIHPTAQTSPFFRSLDLKQYGLEWIHPDIQVAHPFDDGSAALQFRDIDVTGATLGIDAAAYRRLMGPLVNHWEQIQAEVLRPIRVPPHNPLALAHFGVFAGMPAAMMANLAFKDERAKGFFAGFAAHSLLSMDHLASASFGLVLAILGHAVGWPLAKGGSQSIAGALVAHLRALGGEIVLSHPVRHIDDLPRARAYLFDTSPRTLATVAGSRLPDGYIRQLRNVRYGPGSFKIDYALSEAIPWKSAAAQRAGTVHLGGSLAEISASERLVWRDEHPERPYTLVAQQSVFDESRAPDGKHTAWAYCHVPNGSTVDMTDAIEAQIERYAPGFRDTILAKHTFNTAQFEDYNANYVGGDINGGVQDIGQLLLRPVKRLTPYATPGEGIYLCSASTPPGGGVHGLCGMYAARRVLRSMT